MNARLLQFIGLIFLIASIFLSFLVIWSTSQIVNEFPILLASGFIAWMILAFPALAVGGWLLVKGTRAARLGDISADLITLVQREGRIGVDAASRELGVHPKDVVDAAEKLVHQEFPLLYLDARNGELVSPSAVSLQESLLHLLHAQRRMTFDQIAKVTNSTDEQIVEALKELSESGKFRGTIDANSRVVYTAEAVAQLPKAITKCPNCGGRLPSPVLPGEEEECPYCGHVIVAKV